MKFGAGGCLARISSCGQLNNCSVMSCYVKISEINPKKPRRFLKCIRLKVSLTPATSKTKQARTMKLCTVIVSYIVSINKQLKFLKSYCSIVCAIVLL